jgi:hypothetical protein
MTLAVILPPPYKSSTLSAKVLIKESAKRVIKLIK